tara:strand:- start:353 stop:523 length:171 start_codon:yes stop_codon:yes gene_type:complete
MSNWNVTLKEIEIYCVGVEAETESEAIEKAFALIETDEGKATHHDNSDGEAEAYEE